MEWGGGLLELLCAALGQVALPPRPWPDHVCWHVGALHQLLVQVILSRVKVCVHLVGKVQGVAGGHAVLLATLGRLMRNKNDWPYNPQSFETASGYSRTVD